MTDRQTLYIDGAWTKASTTDVIEVRNPATEAVAGTIPAGTTSDLDRAVEAARSALPGWSRTSPGERAAALRRLHQAMTSRREQIIDSIATELGAPLKIAAAVHTDMPLSVLDYFASATADFEFTREIGNSRVYLEPMGVVGAITPWNYPLHQVMAKVAAALAAGCTVVLKPSELAPGAAFLLFEAIDEAGLPAGVANLVTGMGDVVGAAIAEHPGIDMVSFTGSSRVGRSVAAAGAQTVKKVSLELGGKSANLILPDADLTAAVKVGIANCMLNSGQTCTAWTRMLVPAEQYAQAVDLAAQAAAKQTVGDPFDAATRLGPLVSATQRERVRGYIDTGVAEGARLVTGGGEPPLPTGYFVAPTVFADVRSDMRIAQEEIFGPVLSILPYADEDEAVRIANDSDYGLAAGVWSSDESHAVEVARRIDSGQVDINGGRFNPMAPFGGYKQSGVGRELGPFGLEEFLQPKSLQF